MIRFLLLNWMFLSLFVQEVNSVGCELIRCRSNLTCIDRQGTCDTLPCSIQGHCIDLDKKLGACPSSTIDRALIKSCKRSACSSDKECTGVKKCCKFGCTHHCTYPVDKPGYCPIVLTKGNLHCVKQCGDDAECADDMKCCSNGCGMVCLNSTIAGCPLGVSVANCLVDPCQVTPCAAFPNAKCRSNYCGGCNAVFFVNGLEVDCNTECLPGVDIVDCAVDPCRVTSCKAFPNAECRQNYCGGCFADFFVGGTKVDCQKKCPKNLPQVRCKKDPCDGATCKAHPNAECRQNYCGGCFADFFVGGTKVDCQKKCPNNLPQVRCKKDPCDGATCKAHPNAECRANYCGGCKAEYFVEGMIVKCKKRLSNPGKCPMPPPSQVGTCVEMCTSDKSCPGKLMCCSNGCGHTCADPVGVCRRKLLSKKRCKNLTVCRGNKYCPKDEICCKTKCGRNCVPI